jgi:hypothetical protein
MKKRKSPIFLITIVVALISLVAMKGFPKDEQDANTPPPPDPAQANNVLITGANVSPDLIKQAAKNSMASKQHVPPKVAAARGSLIEMPIERPAVKPTPDSSGVQGGWWDSEAYKGGATK